MAFQIADRVKETTTTTGTGTLDLGGAVSQFQTFVAGIGNGNETYYSIEDPTGTDWEVGIGTVTDAATDTLSRDTVLSSSNGGSLVNFGAGEKVVFSTQPASKTVIVNSDTDVNVSANINATSFVGSGAGLTTLNATNVASGTLDDARLTGNVVLTSGATFTGNVALGDSNHLNLGDSQDLQLYHDGTNSYIQDAGLGKIKILTNELNINNAADTANLIVAKESAEVKLNHNGATKLTTTATGISVTGTATATTFDGSGASLTTLNASNVSSGTLDDARLSGNVVLTSGATFTGNVAFGDLDYVLFGATGEYQIYHDHANGVSNIKDVDVGGTLNLEADNITLTGPVTATANVSLGDDDFLRQGDSNEFSIVHEGSTGNTYLRHTPSAPLYIRADKLRVTNSNLTETLLRADVNGDVQLYYDNSVKLATTSSGIDVTGTVNVNAAYTLPTADGTSGQVLTTDGLGGLTFETPTTGDITGVTAGDGLTGGGTTGAVTLNVGAGTGIDVAADTVSVDVSDFMTNGSNNRVLTATGTDAMNAESGLTYDGSTLAVTGTLTADAISLGDNENLSFGASNDLVIHHDGFGGNSYIQDAGTGDLYIDASTNLNLRQFGTSELYAKFIANGGAELYHNGTKKFETTATGISVTGTVVESSSLAYKENVQPLEFNDAIYNVNAVKYDRKDGSSKDEVGVIAEELYKVLPDLVECKDGKPDAVKYTKMTMYLLEALKKQNQEIQELKAKLN